MPDDAPVFAPDLVVVATRFPPLSGPNKILSPTDADPIELKTLYFKLSRGDLELRGAADIITIPMVARWRFTSVVVEKPVFPIEALMKID